MLEDQQSMFDADAGFTSIEPPSTFEFVNNDQPTTEDVLPANNAKEEVSEVIPQESTEETTEEVETKQEVEEDLTEETEKDSDLVKKLRNVIKQKTNTLKTLQSQTISEEDKTLIELGKKLYAFDNKKQTVNPSEFASHVVQNTPETAISLIRELLKQTYPADGNNTPLEAYYWESQGLDPNKIELYREITKNNSKLSDLVEVPSYVPPEYKDAFKALSPKLREQVELDLSLGDLASEDFQSAMEILANTQAKITADNEKNEKTRLEQERLIQETEKEIWNEGLNTYKQMFDSFKETPTYQNIKPFGNDTVDNAVKQLTQIAFATLADTESLAGQMAMNLLEELGVTPELEEIAQIVQGIDANLETKIKAGKFNALESKKIAETALTANTVKLQAKRNALFTNVMKAIADAMQNVSKEKTAKIQSNAGMPHLSGNQVVNGDTKKMSPADIIEHLSKKASS